MEAAPAAPQDSAKAKAGHEERLARLWALERKVMEHSMGYGPGSED